MPLYETKNGKFGLNDLTFFFFLLYGHIKYKHIVQESAQISLRRIGFIFFSKHHRDVYNVSSV